MHADTLQAMKVFLVQRKFRPLRKLKPKLSFDTVRVEAASGVGSMTPPCSFSAIQVGGSYVCRVDVSHKAGEASLTLNVVGERTTDPANPRVVESEPMLDDELALLLLV